MGVPRPPTSTPSRRAPALSVKPESSRAAGTLLITWLASRLVQYSRPERSLRSRLSDLGDVDLAKLCRNCAAHPLMKNNPVSLDEEALREMFEALA